MLIFTVELKENRLLYGKELNQAKQNQENVQEITANGSKLMKHGIMRKSVLNIFHIILHQINQAIMQNQNTLQYHHYQLKKFLILNLSVLNLYQIKNIIN